MSDSLADRLRGLLATDVYTEKGRLRADDQLVRQRVTRGLGESSARIRELISRWRADRVPPSTREQPFPPAEVMEPIRRAERLIRTIDDTAVAIKGLPVLNQDKVWDRVRRVGLQDLLQFDWTMVGESDLMARDLDLVGALDELDVAAYEARVRKIKDLVGERQRFIEIS
ncbi:MAG TPA: hypothetical protein VMR14_02475 [Streptosporangiaceae bacterium]|jgi:hypothetical protein|nr:hypothetical protein [Streptosporangiaceae bacterium]